MKSFLRNFIGFVLVALAATFANAQWAEIPKLPVQLIWPMTAQVGGTVYVFGGITGATASKSVYAYKQGDADWTKLTVTMPKAKIAGYAATVNGKIYLVGGGTNLASGVLTLTNETYEFDPAAATFTTKAAIPSKVGFFAGAEVGGKIYCIGGATGISYQLVDSNVINIYDPAADKWTRAVSKPASNARFAASAVLGGKIFTAGGLKAGTYTDEAYRGTVNGNTITWEQLAPLPKAFAMASGGSANGKVVIVGGEGQTVSTEYASTYVYDEAAADWSESYAMPIPASRAGQLAAIGNDLYYAGGNAKDNRAFKFTVSDIKQALAVIPTQTQLVNVGQGESTQLTVGAQNLGVAPLTVEISIPGSVNWLNTPTPTISIDPLQKADFSLNFVSGTMSPGLYKTTVTLKTNDPAHATMTFDVIMYVLSSDIKQQNTTVVLEEGTGDWCGYCPQGHEIVAQLKEQFGDQFISMQYHGGSTSEPFKIPAGEKLLSKLQIAGYPNGAVQRWLFPGEAAQMTNRGSWASYVQQVLDQAPKSSVAMKVLEYKYDKSSRKVTAKVELQRTAAVFNNSASTIRLTTVVTESDIVANQKDYRLPSPYDIPDYIHHDIVRQMQPNELGAIADFGAGTILEGNVLAPGDKAIISLDFTATSAIENSENSDIVFIVNEVTGGTTLGAILQGQEMPLESSISGSSVKTSDNASIFTMKNSPNPAVTNTTITYSLTERAPVSLVVRDVMGREVARLVSNEVEDAGTYTAGLDVSKLANGTYFYTLSAGGKSLTGTVLVTK